MTFAAGKREAVLGKWNEELQKYNVNVRHRAVVTAISGSKGNFEIKTAGGETCQAENVVLCIGLQGNIRKLAVTIGCEETDDRAPVIGDFGSQSAGVSQREEMCFAAIGKFAEQNHGVPPETDAIALAITIVVYGLKVDGGDARPRHFSVARIGFNPDARMGADV